MAGSALRRLIAEYKRKNNNSFDSNKNRSVNYLELTSNPPDGILAGPLSDENFFEWEALIT